MCVIYEPTIEEKASVVSIFHHKLFSVAIFRCESVRARERSSRTIKQEKKSMLAIDSAALVEKAASKMQSFLMRCLASYLA